MTWLTKIKFYGEIIETAGNYFFVHHHQLIDESYCSTVKVYQMMSNQKFEKQFCVSQNFDLVCDSMGESDGILLFFQLWRDQI